MAAVLLSDGIDGKGDERSVMRDPRYAEVPVTVCSGPGGAAFCPARPSGGEPKCRRKVVKKPTLSPGPPGGIYPSPRLLSGSADSCALEGRVSGRSTETGLKLTDIAAPEYFHKVVDCQWACPAHTPVPEYIRLIAAGRYTDAYMINWESNVFPGVLGRTCDRPCEPACRRVRIEKEPVAICRLKRVAADNKDDISPFLPRASLDKNGKRVALVGGGPASLTVAR